jgi:hypothetical protein
MCRICAELADKFGDIEIVLLQTFSSLARIVVTLHQVITLQQQVDIITAPSPSLSASNSGIYNKHSSYPLCPLLQYRRRNRAFL